MKDFKTYLAESKKTYKFKIGVAGELPEHTADHFESALGKFGLINMSPFKKTPITKRPLDFPQLENVEVHYTEAEVSYPTTDPVLYEYLCQMCTVPKSHLIVRNANAPQEEYQAEKENKPYETKLETPEMEQAAANAQELTGTSRAMDLLKELESYRAEREVKSDGGTTKDNQPQMSNVPDGSIGTKSPIGSYL